MGIDFEASSGIGFRILKEETMELNNDYDFEEDCFDGFIDDKFPYTGEFNYNNYNYGYDTEYEYFACIANSTPVKDIEAELKRLEQFLKDNKIVYKPIDWNKELTLEDCYISETIIW